MAQIFIMSVVQKACGLI